MEHENPYAPPAEGSAPWQLSGAAGSDTAGLTFSEREWAIVTDMAKWMRIVSTVLYVAGAMTGLGGLAATCGLAAGGAAALASGASAGLFLLLTALLFLAATWLRRAAGNFTFGVIDNATNPLAAGFRNLRLYLILYGIFGLISLAGSIVPFFIEGLRR